MKNILDSKYIIENNLETIYNLKKLIEFQNGNNEQSQINLNKI